MGIAKALVEAKTLLKKEGVEGVGVSHGRIVIYAREGVSVPASIQGIPTEVIRTSQFTAR